MVVFRYGGYAGRLEEVLWRTIIRDSACSSHPTIQVRRAALGDIHKTEAWLKYLNAQADGNVDSSVVVAAGPESRSQHQQWANYIFPPEYEDIKVDVVVNTLGAQLFVTDDGRIGSGPFFIASQEGVAPGDEIYLAAGSRMPLLLRRAGPPSAERGDVAYALVGVCYLHGIMDGEGTATFGNFRSVYIT